MHTVDWILLISFLLFISLYGVWKTRGKKDIQGFFMADRSTPWFAITISVMATQASAITFLSTPGQAFVDGMRFVQFYFGLPIAMVIICATAVPIFHRLKVYTAYEYLEQRFDLKNRLLGSTLFLIQRGLAVGFTILAPALIISVLLGWNFRLTIFFTGGLVILYTAAGGTEAVSKTHMLQMAIITIGMGIACFMVFHRMPNNISFLDSLRVAGKLGKLNVIDFTFNLKDRYTIWSGLIGGTFLALSYFGTDQSQVQRYLSGRSIGQIRMGLLANGMVKVPMQFFILFIGAMIFVFYQFVVPPLFFNPVEVAKVKTGAATVYEKLEREHQTVHGKKQQQIRTMLDAMRTGDQNSEQSALQDLQRSRVRETEIRRQAVQVIRRENPGSDGNDTNFIFLGFVIHFLPAGLVGLILAAILSASMQSTAAELNALASVTVIDIYQRLRRHPISDRRALIVSKLATVFWGLYAMAFALLANHLGSLIEAVNVLGSLFYGTILGIFLVAFYFRRIGGHAVFIAALIAELTVLACFFFTPIPYLWFNVIGAVVLILLAHLLQPLFPISPKTTPVWDRKGETHG